LGKVFVKRLLSICSFALLVSALGCAPSDQNSDLQVVNGSATNEFPEVVLLRHGNAICTATCVSPTTVITASHCIMRGVATLNRIPATRIIRNPEYRHIHVGPTDIAAVVWNQPICRSFARVGRVPPRPGDRLTIVGYGVNDTIRGTGAGTKRFGHNIVQEVDEGMIYFAAIQGDFTTGAASGGGDSGGPLFINGQLVGVTSGGFARGSFKGSLYVDATSPGSRRFLEFAVRNGADIPGIGEEEEIPPTSDQERTPPGSNQTPPNSSTSPGATTNPGGGTNSPGANTNPVSGASSNPPGATNQAPPNLLDCNRDYRRIPEVGSGVCYNTHARLCYRYDGNDVQYSLGRVECPSR
jgi:hypothetical protein